MEALFFYLTATTRNGGTRQTERGLLQVVFFFDATRSTKCLQTLLNLHHATCDIDVSIGSRMNIIWNHSYLTTTIRHRGTRQTERGLPASSFSFAPAEAPNAYRLY